jgi:signal transduction histidine kinase
MEKSAQTRLPLIRSLMIVAQVLLMVLSIHWLNMQYKEQKQMLLNNISDLWMSSQQQMIDSMLMTEYINPAIDSSTHFDFKFEFNTDSILSYHARESAAMMRVEVPPMQIPAEESRIIVRVNDSMQVNTITRHRGPSFVKRDLVLKGVKLFVNEFSDSTEHSNNLAEWAFGSDTNFLKRSFDNKIAGLNPRIKVKWITKDIQDSNFMINAPPPVFHMLAGNKSIEADIAGYQLIVFGKILPQIVFALLLVLLTALAFLISHRSLRTQAILNEQRNDFIRNMSHEIKTPVATVKVALEALKKFERRNDPRVMDEYLEMATSETERLELLINRVMNVSDQGDAFLMNRVNTDMKELITGVLSTLKPRLEQENAIVNTRFPEQNCLISIDPLHVRGVLINLIDNSLKYCIGHAEINISLFLSHDSLLLEVADNGKGIPENYQDRIFDKFFRVPSGDVHNIKGYGLGLSYAKSVMQYHKGSINFRAAVPTGSVFTLSFPNLTT